MFPLFRCCLNIEYFQLLRIGEKIKHQEDKAI